MNHLIPGETILADRGFDIEDSVGIYCARVSIPNVRLHVERVIGTIHQKYTFLSGTQPIDFITPRENGVALLDKVVSVCCALINPRRMRRRVTVLTLCVCVCVCVC